jgi:hypothetical protein
VHLRNVGVADKNGVMEFTDNTGNEIHPAAGNRLGQGGNAIAKIVKLDDDIKEDTTFIKMDIEGAELAAIIGAQNHIKRSKPKLAISLYHNLSDLIEIPKLIKQLVPEYKFYLQHCPTHFPFPTEYVLLAVIDKNSMDYSPQVYAAENLTMIESPILNNVSPQATGFLADAIAAVKRDDLQAALDEIVRLAEDEIPDEYAESYLLMAQKICASLEYEEGWTFFSKLWADYLFNNNRKDEAD